MLITIGAFDGFHKGHSELLRICRELTKNSGDWGVVTFNPHPSVFMGKIQPLFMLQERELIRRVLGIPKMYVLKFDDEMMRLSPSEFWRFLRDRIDVDGLVMGSDFHFGYGRSGDAEALRELARSDGIERVIIADLKDKPRYSSTTIREAIMAGNVETAAEILGYPFFMIGRVIHGNERGRTMKFPTANIAVNKMMPAYGVYSSAIFINGRWYCGALSVGNNPTFNDVEGTRAEVHVLDFDGDIYGEEVITMILGRVRGIRKFSGKDELSAQITNDVAECRRIYDNYMNATPLSRFVQHLPLRRGDWESGELYAP